MEFTADAVLALAPDDASAKAARGLTSPAKWPTLGADQRAVWGECQGSGSKPYQTQVDLSGPTFKCSCPSRKFPCKHGLALLLVRSAQPQLFAAGQAAPPWVQEWMSARQDRADRKEQRAAERAAAPASPESVEKREAQRWKKIEEGLDQLQLWMCDQVERGLANLGTDARDSFHAMAARLVDQQAPSLAQRLRDAAQDIDAAPDWPARVLRCFGQLQLAIEATRRRAALEPEALADLRWALGWTQEKEAVLAQGERLRDEWLVLAVVAEKRDAKLEERRVWLQGLASGRRALLADFAFGGSGFDAAWIGGHVHKAELAFYPGAVTMRALVAAQDEVAPGPLPSGEATAEWQGIAQRWSRNPWLRLQPLLVPQAALAGGQEDWSIDTGTGRLPLRIAGESAWLLAAQTGGHAVPLFGEWDGTRLTPLTAWTRDGLWTHASLE